jgi:glutamate transport system ATP-binding protein
MDAVYRDLASPARSPWAFRALDVELLARRTEPLVGGGDSGTEERGVDSGRLIELRGVRKAFGDNVVLDDIDLAVDRGEAIVIAGPSGSGKSTLLRCVNGLEPCDAGEIRFDGRSITRAGRAIHELRAEIGMVFQQFNLFPHMTVLDNITLAPVNVKRLARRDARERARALLDRVGIAEKADSHPADLSGGQQQRVAIARALAMEPKLMLFDEPTSALDPEMIREVLDVMRDLARDGMTMLVVTHEMGFAREVCDRLVFIDEGRIVEEGPPAEFFAGARSQRAREFVDKIIHH